MSHSGVPCIICSGCIAPMGAAKLTEQSIIQGCKHFRYH